MQGAFTSHIFTFLTNVKLRFFDLQNLSGLLPNFFDTPHVGLERFIFLPFNTGHSYSPPFKN